MDLLTWLLLGALLGVGARFAAPWVMRRLAPGGNPEAGTVAGPTWRSASVVPGRGACETARRLANRRWLAGEAPRLPLAGCDSSQCQCRYRRYADRREEEDRRNPLDTLGHFGGGAVTSGGERRRHSERRAE